MVLTMKGCDANAVCAVQQFLGERTRDNASLLARREKLGAQDMRISRIGGEH
jgi:hypothetical protein